MGVENRPYAGTWSLNQQKLVQHTPDALVYINGDLSLPGCAKCSGRIDVQQFITSVGVDAGTNPGATSANFSLSIPYHHTDSFIRDGQFILKPGLEVHIYKRGYFPVQGMYATSLQQKNPTSGGVQPGFASDMSSIGNLDLSEILNYPYYHVFHGVVTQTSHSYSGGFWTASVNCASMLHFWAYHNISTNASLFGARPTNSKLRMSLVGHNFTRMTPYEIVYTLFHDTAGSAGGVGFALSAKTNQGAKSTVLNKSLFSVAIEYWKRRFEQGMMNLRMHGASGVLFSAAQAAFLGRLSTSQSIQILRGRYPSKERSSKVMPILSAARSLGFFDEKFKDALTFAEKSRPQRGQKFDLNIAAMQAFVTDISQFGQVNLFESSYENKLDIVNKVTNLTGFEFYQDVDGDFVFKPPMYNLDTSSSRIYRIEDIDIINYSPSEKEPEVTYMTVKGSHFKNIGGLGLDNEWGVRGQYIDYRLVAQFGWRSGSFETSYFNNPRSMFFAAINRMDIMNSGINSASLVIPIRPEIRPGYPVYIRFLDCFYYVQSIQHSFQFGSQCTTTLNLTAKRAKFYPPGDPNKRGIESIDLGNMLLPPRPLEVRAEDGTPRKSGFPNVVMALDPNQINPLFFVVGSDIENISDPQTLRNLIRAAADNYQVIRRTKDDNGKEVFAIDVKQGEKYETFVFSLENRNVRLANSSARVIDIVAAARTYTNRQTNQAKKLQSIQKKVSVLLRKIGRAEKARNRLFNRKQTSKVQARINALGTRINNLNNQKTTLENQFKSEQKSFQEKLRKDPGLHVILDLIKRVGDQFVKQNSSYSDLNSTASLLDILSDKKASFSNGQLPGAYRYYSASHPDVKHQGQGEIEFTDKRPSSTTKNTMPRLTDPKPVRGFQKQPQKKFPGGQLPEAELGTITPSVGIKILTNDPNNAEKVVQTSEIRTIEFATHSVTKSKAVTNYKPGDPFTSLGPKVFSQVQQLFLGQARVVDSRGGDPIKDTFEPLWNQISNWSGISKKPIFPTSLGVEDLTSSNTIGEIVFVLQGSSLGIPLGISLRDVTPRDSANAVVIASKLANWFATRWFDQANKILVEYFNTNVKPKLDRLTQKGATAQDRKDAQDAAKVFDETILQSVYAAAFSTGKKRKSIRKDVRFADVKTNIESPVFPVSDAKGYQVVGTYRYGRDVDIEPNGVFDQLLKQDPTRFASRQAIQEYVDTLLGKKPILVETKKTVNGKTVVTKKETLQGEKLIQEARKRLAENLKSSLLNNLTQDDIIRLGIGARNKENPNQLDLKLSNWIADHKEGVQKLPVANAAFALGDLQSHIRKNVCSCKISESGVLLEAFDTSQFALLSQSSAPNQNSGDVDEVSQWLLNQITLQEPAWRANQDALRGAVADKRDRGLFETFQNQVANITNRGTALSQEINTAITNFENALGDDDG